MRTPTRAVAAAILLAALCPIAPAAASPAHVPSPASRYARSEAVPPTAAAARPAGIRPIPGHYLVTLQAGVDPTSVLDRLGVRPRFVYRSAFSGFAAPMTTLQVKLLRQLPAFQAIEQDAEIDGVDTTQSRVDPSQHRAAGSWGLDRINQRDLPLDGNGSFAHDGSGITAYIIDTGIDYDHSEFGGRAEPGFDAVDDGRDGADCNGHGTHVAGTVGGNTFGVARRVNLVSVRVLGCDGKGDWSGVVAGLDWVAGNAHRPAVANASLGGTPPSDAVDNAANAVADSGVFLSVAAGNDTADACRYSPGRAPNVFTVGATTSSDAFAEYSNLDACVQILAPGSDIVSARLGGGSVAEDGTSMAAPHVTGVAALYKQAFGDLPQIDLQLWFWSNTTRDRISELPDHTPNYLLYSAGL